ncbi:MAG: class I SAM-dependent methyltransferase [Alphaproteobacteria bacterium]
MTENPDFSPPSPWVMRFLSLFPKDGEVLDLACGRGRHALPMANSGLHVTAVDRDVSRLPQHDRITAFEADLEDGSDWPLALRDFDGIVVTNYLYRPLLPILVDSLRPGGVLIYETFAVGNEAFGRPRNPDFLLRDGELLEAVSGKLSVVAYESGRIDRSSPAVFQRIAAVNAPTAQTIIPLPV